VLEARFRADPLRFATDLFDQQLWCWGYDVRGERGNLLLTNGFERIAPPDAVGTCSSVYRTSPALGTEVVLRGYGVFYGDRSLGGIFLRRFGFDARWSDCWRLDQPPWRENDLPALALPTPEDHGACCRMVGDFSAWSCRYEHTILNAYGHDYRLRSLAARGKPLGTPLAAGAMELGWALVAEAAWSGKLFRVNADPCRPIDVAGRRRGGHRSRLKNAARVRR
jgi:hypothetical protein